MAAPIIINQSKLFLTVAGRRLTALPSVGAIATMVKDAALAVRIGGLHKTSTLVLIQDTGYTFTVNVGQFSDDHHFLDKAINLISALSRPVAATLSYGTTIYVSGSVVIAAQPDLSLEADGAPFSAFAMIGSFQIASIGKYAAPAALTADEILA